MASEIAFAFLTAISVTLLTQFWKAGKALPIASVIPFKTLDSVPVGKTLWVNCKKKLLKKNIFKTNWETNLSQTQWHSQKICAIGNTSG